MSFTDFRVCNLGVQPTGRAASCAPLEEAEAYQLTESSSKAEQRVVLEELHVSEQQKRITKLRDDGTESSPVSFSPASTISLFDKIEQRKVRLLAQVSEVLATTLEFEDTLTNIAQLVVDNLADLCIIHFIDDDGVARRARVFCRDPEKAWVCDALMRMPPGLEHARIVQSVLESKRPALVANVTPAHIRSWSASEEHLAALQSIGPKSAMVAPLLVHGRLLGALSLISSDPSRRYGPGDLAAAVIIAGRSAFFLENARLFREAKRATQAREDMLRIVAHDLRNPLAAILASAAVLRRNGQECDVAEEIALAATRMGSLIQDLIDVTRLEVGRLPLKAARLDAGEIVSDIEDTQRLLASTASLDLRLDVAPALPQIWADRDRLLQVFENLIGNAIKFTKPGGHITVGASERAGEVQFSVTDTGCGMASNQLPHVFDLFWQAPEAAHRGAGLGLPIVKGVVEAHGGRIWVQSAPGQGSTFFFTVPTASQATEKVAARVHTLSDD